MLQPNSQSQLKYLLLLITILTIATTSRMGIFSQVYNLSPISVQQNDTRRYEEPALHLLEHGTLAINPMSPQTTTLSTTPVYSLFIAGVYKTFGLNNRYTLIILQIIVSVLSILILYFLAQQLWNQQVALIAATLMTIEPLQILYSQIILSETLFSFFLISSLLALVKLITSQKEYKWALTFGIIITLATMTRPISYYLVLCIILGLIIFKPHITQTWPKLFIILALILTPFLLTTTAWKTRNADLTGIYALNNAMSETMLYWKAKGVLQISESLSEEQAQQKIIKKLPPLAEMNTPKKRADAESMLAKEIILGDFKSYLKLSVIGLKAIILGPGLASQAMYYDNKNKGEIATANNDKQHKPWYIALIAYGIAFVLFSYILFATGYLYAVKRATQQHRVIHVLMLGSIVYFILISTGHIATDSRMRVPIIPVILLYASYGVYNLLEALKSRNIRKNKR